MARGRKDYEKAVIAVESEGYKDLHGRILMNDDFEDTPFKWYTAGTGTHFESRQAMAAYNGSFGAELDITSDAPPIPRYARMIRTFPVDVTERVLAELFWRANVLTRMSYLIVEIYRYDGTYEDRITLTYYPATQLWTYRNAAGGETQLVGGAQTFADEAWNELTISVDFAANEYITFKSNNLEVNMGGIACSSVLNPAGAHASIWIWAYNTTANKLLVHVDDAVVRELEV